MTEISSKPTQALVSVVLATFNGEKFIKKQLESIINQSYRNIEIVVVDDSSDDNTMNILQEYANLDNRIYVSQSEKNLGLVKNFERGLKLTQGGLIVLSDQDDIFDVEKIKVLVENYESAPDKDLFVSDLRVMGGDGSILADSMWTYHKSMPMSGRPLHRLLQGNFATGCAMMITRRLLNSALPFPRDIIVHDWWLAVVASSKVGGGIHLVNETLTDYRQHEANVVGAQPLFKPNIKMVWQFVTGKRAMLRHWGDTYCRWQEDIRRLNSYLKRTELWSLEEIKLITEVKDMYEQLVLDPNRKLYERLNYLPSRLKHTFPTKRPRTIIKMILITLFPSLIIK